MASAVQIRYLERARGVTFEHPYKNPQFAAWTRYFDHPVHQPRHSKLPTNSTLSWYCGYGSWYFWYAMGDMLGDSDGDGNPEAESRWYELLDGDNAFSVSSLPGSRWRVTLRLSGNNTDQKTAISHIEIAPGEAGDTK